MLRLGRTCRRKYKAIFYGTDQFAQTCLEAVQKNPNVELLSAVFSEKALEETKVNKYCRSQKITARRWLDHKKWMLANRETVLKEEVDFAVVASFGHFIPKSIIELYRFGGINVHGSFLPAYRGATPLQRAILEHEPYTGVTIQQIHTKTIDLGDILLQSEKIELHPDITVAELYDRAGQAAVQTLDKFFDHPESYISQRTPQPEKSPTMHAPVFKPDERWHEVRFQDLSAEDIYARFRVFGDLTCQFVYDAELLDVRIAEMKVVQTPPELLPAARGSLYSKQLEIAESRSKAVEAVIPMPNGKSIVLKIIRIIKSPTPGSETTIEKPPPKKKKGKKKYRRKHKHVKQKQAHENYINGDQIRNRLLPTYLVRQKENIGKTRHSRYFTRSHFEHNEIEGDAAQLEYRKGTLDFECASYYFL